LKVKSSQNHEKNPAVSMDLTFDHGPYGAPWSYPARIAKARERKVLSLELEVTQYIPEIVRKILW
jgi:hypothetical protein